MTSFRDHIQEHQPRFLSELGEWLRIPSISSLPEHASDMVRSADHLANHLRRLCPDKVEVWPTARHPAVFACWRTSPQAPTVLIYGHHDVQPVDPLPQWTTPPFEASVRDGRLYGRGATDDKGQLWMHVKAIETLQQCLGRLPLNVSMIVEGEEEIGSPSLIELFRRHPEELTADVVCVSDTDMFQPGVPSICVMMRGIACFEIELRTADGDLHSGSFGGAVANASTELARLLGGLHDGSGRIAIEGFYDDVRVMTEGESEELHAVPFDREVFRSQSSSAVETGEGDYSTLERLWTRPSLDVNGITAGFQGPGSKTVIPSVATAKLSFRIVADQDPARVHALLRAHVEKRVRRGVRWEVRAQHSGLPYRAPTKAPVYAAARRALQRAFGRPAVFAGEGGSIPFARAIGDATGAPCLLLGFGLPEGNAHAPDEWLLLDNFQKGIESLAHLYEEMGATGQR